MTIARCSMRHNKLMKTVLGSVVLFIGLGFLTAAAQPVSVGEKRIEELRQKAEKARLEYRDALVNEAKVKEAELNAKADAIDQEKDRSRRKDLAQEVKVLRAELEALNQKIRAINATDVVRYSDRKHKWAALFTHTR